MQQDSSTPINDFVVDDCFADDDLITSETEIKVATNDFKQIFAQQKSFLERDNFEYELGPSGGNEDPFGENFADMASFEIIDVFGEGDFSARYKKNLKALYLVHPTKFIRFVWRIFQPIISFKFEKKLHYVNSLNELSFFVSTTNLNLPQPIIDFDQSVSSSSLKSTINQGFDNNVEKNLPPRPTQQFNVSLKFIMDHNPNCDIPPIVSDLIDFLQEHGLQTKGIFRRSANVTTVKSLQQRINMGEKIDFLRDPELEGDLESSIVLASVLLKTFLRSLGEPLITNKLYPELTLLAAATDKPTYINSTRDLLRNLPPENLLLLKRIIEFLQQIEAHSDENLMNANNLSVVFGPNLTWPTDQQVPMSQLNNLNKFCYTLIKHFDLIFLDI